MGHSKINPHTRLKELYYSEREDFWVIVAYGGFAGLFSLIVPIAVQSLVNSIGFGSMLQPIFVLTFLVFIILIFSGLMGVLQKLVVEVLQQRIFARVSTELAYRLPRVQIKAYDSIEASELVNRFFDILIVQKSAAILLVDGLAILLQTFLGLILLAFYHPLLLAFDLILLLCLYVIFIPLGKRGIPTSIEESKKKYAVASWLEEVAKNQTTFRGQEGLDYSLRRADQLAANYVVARKSHYQVLLRQIIGTFALQTGASALLLGLGGWLVVQKQLTLGQLVASELIVGTVVAGFTKFGKYLETYYDLAASADKLGTLFDLPLENTGSEKLPELNTPYPLKFKNVSFIRTEREPLLHEVNLDLKPGAKIAIIGGNGTGKSVFLDLVFGLRSPTQGAVEIAGIDLREIDFAKIRQKIAIVRSIEIFDGSIFDNIRVGRSQIDLLKIREVLASLQLLDELSQLPEGLNTALVTSHPNLSHDQAKRLMFARALVGAPQLLILDGALNSMQGDVINNLLPILFSSQAPWTLLVTTHNPEVIKRCDRVFSLSQGTLKEEGKVTP